MRIGIETELNSYNLNQYQIQEQNWLSFRTFEDMTPEVWVKMSEEYYSSTIEYNFTPFDLSKRVLWTVTGYLEEQIERFNLQINWDSPAYVWTHIHIFEEGMVSLNKPRLLKVLLSFILDNLDWVNDSSKARLFSAHQIWSYWSHRNDHSWYKKLEEFGVRPSYYSSAEDRPKYWPIIISPETNRGKPKSLEIRIIPNEYMFDWTIYKLLKEIKDWTIYNREPVEVAEFTEKLALDIWYIKPPTREERERNRRRNTDTAIDIGTVTSYWYNFNYHYKDRINYLDRNNTMTSYNINSISSYLNMLNNVKIIDWKCLNNIDFEIIFSDYINTITERCKYHFTLNIILLLEELKEYCSLSNDQDFFLDVAKDYKRLNFN